MLALFLPARLLLAAAPQTAPTTTDTSYLQRERETEDDAQQECASMKPQATLTRSAIARFFIDAGRLAVEIGGFEATQLTRVNVSDSDGTWLVLEKSIHGRRIVRPRTVLLLNRYDFDQPDPSAIWGTYASINPHSILISGESLQQRIIFNETANATTLTINAKDPGAISKSAHITLTANSLVDLRNAHPAEYRRFLLPLLQKLTDTSWMLPGVTDAYEVFNDIPADETSIGELQLLLPNLDSAVPADRDAAQAKLAAMGDRGLLAAMRTDPSTLTPEQQTALSVLIAHGRRAKVDDPRAARRDAGFLLDCLELDAPGIRLAALQELNKVAGHPVPFDSILKTTDGNAAVDALRRQFLGNNPTSEPSN